MVISDKEYKRIDKELQKKFANYECEGQMTIDDYLKQKENDEEREEER